MLPIEPEYRGFGGSRYHEWEMQNRVTSFVFTLIDQYILSAEYFGLEDHGQNEEMERGLCLFERALIQNNFKGAWKVAPVASAR